MIIAIQLLGSLALTLFFTLFFGLVEGIQDIWIPILMFIGGFIVLTILYFAHLEINHLFTNQKKEVKKPEKYAQLIFKNGVQYIDMIGRVRIHVENGDLIKPDEKYVFICNHRSNFDPIVLLHHFNKNKMAFVSKDSNFKIHCCGGIVKRAGCVSLNRANPREGMLALKQAAELVKNNDLSMVIYPEGTRNKTEEPILPFKNGALRLAQLADVKIAVVVTKNTEIIKKNFPLRHTDVYIKVIEVLPLEKVQSTNARDLSDEIRDTLIEEYELMCKTYDKQGQ